MGTQRKHATALRHEPLGTTQLPVPGTSHTCSHVWWGEWRLFILKFPKISDVEQSWTPCDKKLWGHFPGVNGFAGWTAGQRGKTWVARSHPAGSRGPGQWALVSRAELASVQLPLLGTSLAPWLQLCCLGGTE